MSTPLSRRTRLLRSLASSVIVAVGPAAAQQALSSACGDPFRNHFGPFDYRTAPKETKALVENHHFTPGIESMTRPVNTMMHEMAQDVSYTLNVFPNHPRALLTMTRLSKKYKSDPPPGTATTIECWYDRAIRFRPDDTVARVLYAQYLAKKSRLAEAIKQLDSATTFATDNPFSHFNIGLAYFEVQQYDRALEQAHLAMKLGFPRQDLADRLKRVNKWVEPAGG